MSQAVKQISNMKFHKCFAGIAGKQILISVLVKILLITCESTSVQN